MLATYNLVTDPSTLYLAIGERLDDAIEWHDASPVIHLSLHGSNQGIALTNGAFLSWYELRETLLPINQAMEGRLLICLSSCYGESGCQMAMYENQPLPFFALVGHPKSADWDDSAIVFVTFYHRLFKGAELNESEYLRQKRAVDILAAFRSRMAAQRSRPPR